MSLRSILASVFVVLLVLSVQNSLAKPAVPKDFPVGKFSQFEPSPFGPLVCVPPESYVSTVKEKIVVRAEHPAGRRGDSLAAKSPTLSRYPIDTLDPPVV